MMKRPVRIRPMMPALTEALIAASPSGGPTRRSEIAVELERQRAALDQEREVLGLGLGEVTGDVGAAADVAAARHVSTSGEEMISPSRTIAMRRLGSPSGSHAALPVSSPNASAPLPLKSMATTHSTLCCGCTALAPLISSPGWPRAELEGVALVGGDDLVALLRRLGVGLRLADHRVDGQLGGPADVLLGLRPGPADAGQLDEDAVLATGASVGSETPRASTRPRRTSSVLSTFSALARRRRCPSAWKMNWAPPLRSRPRCGSC